MSLYSDKIEQLEQEARERVLKRTGELIRKYENSKEYETIKQALKDTGIEVDKALELSEKRYFEW